MRCSGQPLDVISHCGKHFTSHAGLAGSGAAAVQWRSQASVPAESPQTPLHERHRMCLHADALNRHSRTTHGGPRVSCAGKEMSHAAKHIVTPYSWTWPG